MPNHTTYLLTGSNLGDRDALLEQALQALSALGRITAVSPRRETEPWGFTHPVPPFLNQALRLETSLAPEELLDHCLQIEKRLGRIRQDREAHGKGGKTYVSRLIDIDILLYDNLIMDTGKLTLPHPHLKDRDFARELLKEILPKSLSLEDFLPNDL
ncbi:MAG: 2-amino-4-hydroxy-6-hydroxymethyldihydropteridine diphosphokinase [Bacteroidales bacterium]|nr:2-amino-4-hydroxy-6-hydroxymethyldihydropteridine diphosphokinase [Bacteroidales bacterium]OQB71518.1 MAG: Bifunctional folate synthesis protein [Bacteroidetes bacterium ADurb.Bin139]MDD4031574.1 2-amino-4-hydroxy-6-hydroxymethyldihydropteridine diphosphokinase [Bacteroidales bacterium]MDD4435704.1 2-amino-4-hydroxy-6-hydroxymethyldihydropteridine diphosphokinase [Bacteroidales bacterium]MDD5732791.1 2-amino-4-hydroxy-6-hydroxymethyldihydropteridine diphosphokinase [Bacteroidales bacterium]